MADPSDPWIERARPVLQDAVAAERIRDHGRAVELYTDGISMLMEALKVMDAGDSRREQLHSRVRVYMEHTEKLKVADAPAVELYKTRNIAEDSIGHGYDKVFEKVLDNRVTTVKVLDAYIAAHHQMCNFVRFCEMLVNKCPKLKFIHLTTSGDDRLGMCDLKATGENFKELKKNLLSRHITLTVKYQDSLHDRQIDFDNGWTVKIGRGLDYFKAPGGKYVIGAHDYNLRPCKATTVDIFKKAK